MGPLFFLKTKPKPDLTSPYFRIGKMLKERLGIDPGEKIGFTIHDDERAKASSIKRQKFFV